MSKLMTRTAAVGFVAVVATGVVVATADPAAATTRCADHYQTKEFDTPGFNVDLKIKLCVSNNDGVHLAYAKGEWGDGNGLPANFDKFTVFLWTQRYGGNKSYAGCSLDSSINLYDSGTFNRDGTSHNDTNCGFFASSGSNLDGGWTADGYVIYNINEDGEDDFRWELNGSPRVR